MSSNSTDFSNLEQFTNSLKRLEDEIKFSLSQSLIKLRILRFLLEEYKYQTFLSIFLAEFFQMIKQLSTITCLYHCLQHLYETYTWSGLAAVRDIRMEQIGSCVRHTPGASVYIYAYNSSLKHLSTAVYSSCLRQIPRTAV